MTSLSRRNKLLLLLAWFLALVQQNDAAIKNKNKLRIVTVNQGVTFNRVEMAANMVGRDSLASSRVLIGWGDFIVNQTQITKTLRRKTGYINVFLGRTDPDWMIDTDPDWVIDNLKVSSEVPAMPRRRREPPLLDLEVPPLKPPATVSTFFPVTNLRRSGSIEATVIFTRYPIKDTKQTRSNVKQLPAVAFPMNSTTVLNYGGADEDSDKEFTTNSIGKPEKPRQNNFRRGPNNYWVEQNPFWTFNVNAAVNQCVPMAVANMLRYLKAATDLKVNHVHASGVGVDGGPGEYTLVGVLDKLMDRHVVNYNEGGGVGKTNTMKGLMYYLYQQRDDVTIRHHGGASIYLIAQDMKSYRVTKYPQFHKVCNEVRDGHGVAMVFGRYDENGDREGGHALRIVACGVTNGVQRIRAIDDSIQGSGGPGRRLDSLDTGLREREYVLSHLDNDGMLNFNNNVNNEFEFVVVVQYSPSTGGGGP